MANNAPSEHFRKRISFKGILRECFPGKETAKKCFSSVLHNGEPSCPKCNSTNLNLKEKHPSMLFQRIKKRCSNKFSLKHGTPMESSKIKYGDRAVLWAGYLTGKIRKHALVAIMGIILSCVPASAQYKPKMNSTLGWDFGEDLGVRGSVAALMPVWNNDKSVFSIQPEMTLWESDGVERYDAGVGLLWGTVLGQTTIANNFVFYDHDFKRGHRRVNIGLDLHNEILHASLNYYHPLSSWRAGKNGFEERARKGLEGNVDITIKRLYMAVRLGLWKDAVEKYLSYGVEAGYELMPGIFLRAEYREDNSIDSWIVGLRFVFNLSDFKGVSQVRNVSRNNKLVDVYTPVHRESRILYEERELPKPLPPEPIIEEPVIPDPPACDTDCNEEDPDMKAPTTCNTDCDEEKPASITDPTPEEEKTKEPVVEPEIPETADKCGEIGFYFTGSPLGTGGAYPLSSNAATDTSLNIQDRSVFTGKIYSKEFPYTNIVGGSLANSHIIEDGFAVRTSDVPQIVVGFRSQDDCPDINIRVVKMEDNSRNNSEPDGREKVICMRCAENILVSKGDAGRVAIDIRNRVEEGDVPVAIKLEIIDQYGHRHDTLEWSINNVKG